MIVREMEDQLRHIGCSFCHAI